MEERKRKLLEQIRKELIRRGVLTEQELKDLALRERGEVKEAATSSTCPTTCGCPSKG